MKPLILAVALITASFAGPASAFGGGFPFPIFDMQFPEDGAFDKNQGKRARAVK